MILGGLFFQATKAKLSYSKFTLKVNESCLPLKPYCGPVVNVNFNLIPQQEKFYFFSKPPQTDHIKIKLHRRNSFQIEEAVQVPESGIESDESSSSTNLSVPDQDQCVETSHVPAKKRRRRRRKQSKQQKLPRQLPQQNSGPKLKKIDSSHVPSPFQEEKGGRSLTKYRSDYKNPNHSKNGQSKFNPTNSYWNKRDHHKNFWGPRNQSNYDNNWRNNGQPYHPNYNNRWKENYSPKPTPQLRQLFYMMWNMLQFSDFRPFGKRPHWQKDRDQNYWSKKTMRAGSYP